MRTRSPIPREVANAAFCATVHRVSSTLPFRSSGTGDGLRPRVFRLKETSPCDSGCARRRFPAWSVASMYTAWFPSAEPSSGNVVSKFRLPSGLKNTSTGSPASICPCTDATPERPSVTSPTTAMLVSVMMPDAGLVTTTMGDTVSSWKASSATGDSLPRPSVARKLNT